MKKTYIAPENAVVHLNVEQIVCTSPGVHDEKSASTSGTPTDIDGFMEGGTHSLGREVVRSHGAWEEW